MTDKKRILPPVDEMTDDEIRREHDHYVRHVNTDPTVGMEHAQWDLARVAFLREEMHRRQSTRIANTTRNLTWAILVLTVANLIAVGWSILGTT